jgi:hypothetical protein
VLSCKQVVDGADRLLAGEISLRQRLAMRLHLLICVHCRRYLRQMGLLLNALPHLRRRAADPAQVDTVMARVRDARNEPPLIPEKNG